MWMMSRTERSEDAEPPRGVSRGTGAGQSAQHPAGQGTDGEPRSTGTAAGSEEQHTDFPSTGEFADGHDPEGFELASQVAMGLSGLLPPSRVGPTRRRRRRVHDEVRSGPGADARDPQPLGAAMARLVRSRGWRTELGLRMIVSRWSLLVGAANAEHSVPEAYHDRILVVRAESSTWAAALRTIAPQLVAELNHRLGEGSVLRVDVRGPAGPSWKHGLRSVPGRGPRDTYG